jgi:hypothetical protein
VLRYNVSTVDVTLREEKAMTTKELIQAEIEGMSEEDLDKLYELIRDFVGSKRQNGGPSILEKLQRIQFDGPEDLAANHDLYFSGEKREESNLH